MKVALQDASTPTRAPGARLLDGTSNGPVLDLRRHREIHGPLTRPRREQLAAACERVGLRGRGGAGFPTAAKLRSTRVGGRTEIVVNVSEGEPASFKDRHLSCLAPHLILDGAVATAHALGTARITVVVRDPHAGAALSAALHARPDCSRVRLVAASGEFVSGEVGAMLRGLQTGLPIPPGRRTIPSLKGLHGHPTFASNAETFAQLGLLATRGPDAFLPSLGGSEHGTMLVTAWGDVPAPGVLEVRAGTSLSDIVGPAGTPVLVGGYHGTWVTNLDGLVLDRDLLRSHGVHLGAGVLTRLPADTCALAEVARVAGWLSAQRVGQCGPCHFGLPAVEADLADLIRGRLDGQGLRRLGQRLSWLPGRGACAHPDGAAQFVRSALAAFPAEVAAHQAHGTCGALDRTILPLDERSVDR